MGQFVTLDEMKAQCRADDGNYDDAYLDDIVADAEEWVVGATRRTVDELIDMGGGTFPRRLRRAVLMLGSHWYEQRGATGNAAQTEIPYSISTLVKPFVRLSETD